jgi:hypothetical protein
MDLSRSSPPTCSGTSRPAVARPPSVPQESSLDAELTSIVFREIDDERTCDHRRTGGDRDWIPVV